MSEEESKIRHRWLFSSAFMAGSQHYIIAKVPNERGAKCAAMVIKSFFISYDKILETECRSFKTFS